MRTKILGATEIQGEMIQKLSRMRRVNPTTYEKAHVRACQEKFLTPHNSKLPLLMEVNHGRWVGFCPECRSGVATEQHWPQARCFDCGAVYHDVLWPSEKARIEETLLLRPLMNQNWTPTETLSTLVVENVRHGIVKGLR